MAMAKWDIKVDTSEAEVKLTDLIRKYTTEAVAEFDISKWLGWGEGIPVLDCRICHGKTVGRITFVADGQTAMHKDCMMGTLNEAPTEMFDEIVQRLEQGEALFGEDDE